MSLRASLVDNGFHDQVPSKIDTLMICLDNVNKKGATLDYLFHLELCN